jgi:hypothetical protein
MASGLPVTEICTSPQKQLPFMVLSVMTGSPKKIVAIEPYNRAGRFR